MGFTIAKKSKAALNAKAVQHRREHSARRQAARARSRPGANDLLPDIAIRQVPLAELELPRRGVRKAEAAQLQRVIVSVKTFGIVAPIIIDTHGIVIDGAMLLLAARELGLPAVPCVTLDHLSPDQLRLLRVTLNRVQETGEWDLGELRLELLDLETLGFDLEVTGFTMPELDLICLDPESGGEEAIPQPQPEVITKLGDLWLCGDHRLLCGNALEAGTYTKLMEEKQATCCFTDPPYNCKIEGNVSGLGKARHADFAMAVGEMSNDEFRTFLSTFLAHTAAHLADGSALFACMDWRQYGRLEAAAADAGLTLANLAVWSKGSGGMGALYRSAHELIGVFAKGERIATNNIQLGKHGRDRTNVWEYAGANRPGSSAAEVLADHPTPKPVELVVDALLDVTDRGTVVIDPFLGSGTTMIAAERSARIAYGIELDPAYVDVAVRRWQAETGEEAVLEATGQRWSEVCAERSSTADTESGEAEEKPVPVAA